MNYNELQKLYPEFKIPYEKEWMYYVATLIQNDPLLEQKFNDVRDLINVEVDIVKYKFKKYNEILEYFKKGTWDLNDIDPKDPMFLSAYTEQDFNNYKPGKYYFSIDLREANWQAFKYAFGLTSLTDFEEFSINTFNLHPAIAKSKSFRQFLFGNTNPKRLQQIQKRMMLEIYKSLPDELKDKIVGKKSDELLFESEDSSIFEPPEYSHYVKMHNLGIQTRVTFFMIEEHTNFGEFVRIKKEFQNWNYEIADKRKLMGVPGNRFYIHYKTLILNGELDERDLYFMGDNKNLAKWIINQ
jgi:hypothetical protein